MAVEFKAGLRDVIAVDSSICLVDGEAGKLYYRGYDIRDLATQASYEEVVHLLWFGELPPKTRLTWVQEQLSTVRRLPDGVLSSMRTYPRGVHPLDALRTAVSVAGMLDPDVRSNAQDANVRKSFRLGAQIPAMVAAWHHLRQGRDPIPPRPEGSTAENFLYMLTGKLPSPLAARTMDMILILHGDHELNASTFAARVAVATFSDLHSAIVAAIGTLKGPRHGGANEDVLAMLLEIGNPANAEKYILDKLAWRASLSKEERAKPEARIPGFGHPVYKVDDPRAGVLREMARQVSAEAGSAVVFQTAVRVYETMRHDTTLPVNVDFFSAVVYHALGIPIDLCTSIFASARISGYCAHAMEQYHERLIRPRARYTGPPPRPFVPLAARAG